MKDSGVYTDMESMDKIKKARAAFSSGNYAAQIGAIYGVAHENDPGSRITDKDFEAAAGQNLWSKIKNWVYGSGAEPELEPGEVARLQGVLDLAEKAARERLDKKYQETREFADNMPQGEYRRGGQVRSAARFRSYGYGEKGPAAKPQASLSPAEQSAGIVLKKK